MMEEVKEYKLNKNVDHDTLMKNGFLNITKGYMYRRKLYERSIILNITIDKEDMFMNLEVYDDYLKQPYIPFYNREMNKTNEVLKTVLVNFEKAISDLIKKGIII
ncbi:hypothetical protein KQI61_05670 [Anaerocolumna aminovalerica]|uniref:hypothetical protein n=1 Tax=Anaerocolumna aminovalerica TaxID=1527 RepID=UPI001C0EAF5C|nr:hypothetical protein [Anaerocolumna aminovalerica]MBU5331678.1 hypothetical protein [Anaerocolumna aminovalerica]